MKIAIDIDDTLTNTRENQLKLWKEYIKQYPNPNYTEEAVKLLTKFSKARAKLTRKKNVSKEEKANFVASYDWNAMTVQDEAVWQKIFEHLDN